MANAVFGYNNLIETGTLAAGSEAAGLPIAQLKVPQGSTAASWQTDTGDKTSADGAWFTVDAGSAATWQAFLLARTSLTPSAQVRWRVGDPKGWNEEANPYGFDLDLTTSPSMTGWSGTRGSGGTGEATYFDSNGDLVTATASQFRFTHDPATLEPLGLLWEPARTNYCRNPRQIGAAAWSAGTNPNNWRTGAPHVAALPAGIQAIVLNGGTEGGVAFVDYRFFGVPTDADPIVRIKPEIDADGVTPTIVAAAGEAWTFQINIRGSTSYPWTPPAKVGIDEYQGTTFLAGSTTDITYNSISASFATNIRTHTRTLTNASTNGIIPYLQYNLTQGQAVDFFVRIGNPQALKSGTNFVTNSAGVTGRVNGSAGTVPTRHGFGTLPAGINPLVWGIGTENGISYVDYRFVGSPQTSGLQATFGSETGNPAAAVLGTAASFSVFCKYASPPVNALVLQELLLLEVTSGSAANGTTAVAVALPKPATERLSASRVGMTGYAAQALGGTTAFIRGAQRFTFPTGSMNIILRIAAAQLELAESVTMPMLQNGSTTTSTPSRLADASLRTITALTNYTISVDGMVMGAPPPGASDKSLGVVTIYSSAVSAGMQFGPTRVGVSGLINSVGNGYNTGGNFGAFNGGGTITVGSIFRAAVGYTASNMAAGANSVQNTFYSAADSHGVDLDRLSLTTAAFGSICYRRIRIYNSRLTDGQIFSGLAGNGFSLDVSSITYDSGLVSAGVQVGYGQSVFVAPSPVIGRHARCDIEDPTNPDNFVAVGLAYAGPVWQPALNIGWETTTNTDARVDEVVTRGGQEYPQYRFEQRRWDVAMQHILDSEIWSQAVEVQRAGRRGGNVLFVPDPEGENRNKEAVFGRVYSQSDIEYSNNTTQYRSWRLRVIERL